MSNRISKVFSLLLALVLCFQQVGFTQGLVELNLAGHLQALRSPLPQDRFRPLHLRYLSYDLKQNNFQLLLDKGDFKDSKLDEPARQLMEYFFIGLSLPNDSFWVNLRPDSPQEMIDDWLCQTDIGKVLLETDLELKKDTAKLTSPQTPQGRLYWDKLYKKAGELFGSDTVNIPTLVRPWIVPGEIIIRESQDNAYIYKATLKVMLEEDYLSGNSVQGSVFSAYEFKDPRLKALNTYSSQLLKELVLPILTKQVNSARKYAALRQVYYSLILAQWFKQKYSQARQNPYAKLIDSRNLSNLISRDNWSKTTYFKAYQASFQKGEYNIQEERQSLTGRAIRTYFSGGVNLAGSSPAAGSPVLGTRIQANSHRYLPDLTSSRTPLVDATVEFDSKGVTISGVGSSSPISRRKLLIGGGVVAIGAAAAVTTGVPAILDFLGGDSPQAGNPTELFNLVVVDYNEKALDGLIARSNSRDSEDAIRFLRMIRDQREYPPSIYMPKEFRKKARQALSSLGKEALNTTNSTTLAAAGISAVTAAGSSSPLQIRTELSVPEGQKPAFFTHDYHQYRLAELFKNPVEKIPDAIVKAVQKKLDQDAKQGKLLSAVVIDSGATDIDIHVTHRYGELNAAVQRLVLEAMRLGCIKAQELGLLKADINPWNLTDLAKAMRIKQREHSITERGSEPVVIAKLIGAGIGASNLILYHEFFVPGSTPLVKLGFLPVKGKEDKPIVRGFRAVVRRVDDILKGKTDGDVYEFEFSSAARVYDDKKKEFVEYKSVNQAQELLALASQPNDYVISEIYAVEGSAVTSTEPLVSVAYQPVYGERGDARTLNPTFIFRSQSGADAVGGVASMFYHANFVPGGPKGEHFVTIKPVTLAEARRAPEKGMANVVVYGWQSEGSGIISRVVDHVGLNPPALSYIRSLAKWLANIMKTHPDDQPYLAPFAAEEKVKPIRRQQAHLFKHAPKEAEVDEVMDEVEREVAAEKLLAITDDKADMGGDFGHNYVPDYMSAVYRATLIHEARKGTFKDGNIIGSMDKGRIKIGRIPQVGDDGHLVMIGDETRNSAAGHQISFLAFTRAYLIAVVSNKKPYGLAQDYQGKEAKAAKANPYFYSQLDQEFLDILREVMPKEYLYMVDNLEAGWKKWEATKETVKLPEPFSGNVSQQGMGSSRFLMDFANGERTFGILAGDKMGPAGINRVIREGVYAALKAGEFNNGLVFEIWDAKAFDEDGNIPLEKLPAFWSDVEDAAAQFKAIAEKAEKEGLPAEVKAGTLANYDFVRSCYGKEDDRLKTSLNNEEKQKLAALLKQSGYVPTERIFLDAEKDREAIYLYLADSDRFNIKQVWIKKNSGWDINHFQDYLLRPILGSSVTKLGILAGGEYIGKDDPVMIGSLKLMNYLYKYLEDNPMLLQGDMNGSHWLGAIPTKFKYAVANVDSHPILVGLRYTLDDNGEIVNIEDVFSSKNFDRIRNKMFKFNFFFKWIASLGGQFAPYGTDVRTVEAAYPLAKFLRQLQDPNSPFLVRNMPAETREKRPIGKFNERRQLFEVATNLPTAASPVAVSVSSPMTQMTAGEYIGKDNPAQLTKVAINGFGRIGKLVLKANLELKDPNYEIVAVNDIDTIENLAHLFRYDSTFGRFRGEVKVEGNDLIINGRRIHVYNEKDPANLPWQSLGVEIVIEASGKFTKKADASRHITAGAKRVVITAPAEGEDLTVVLGVNDDKYDPAEHYIISNASCTTNCLAPVARVLHQKFGIKSGQMVTIHAATNDQKVLDALHKDRRRARATLGNMIPTKTGAAQAIGLVIPELRGKLDGFAVRVPTSDVSMVALFAVLNRNVTKYEVNEALQAAAREGPLSNIIGYTEEELVSSDFLGDPKSGIVDSKLTRVVDGDHVAVSIWYDNEWGYSHRTVELVQQIVAREPPRVSSSPTQDTKREAASPLVMLTLDDIYVKGKAVLVRPDLNTALKDGVVQPHKRITEASKTIKELAEMDAKVVVIAHQGRVGDADYIESLEQHARLLQIAMQRSVKYVHDLYGDAAQTAIRQLKPGEVLVLKNVRPDEKKAEFVKNLEPLFDFFVLDGFSVAHRDAPSVTGFTKIRNVAGRLMQREVEAASRVLTNAQHPYVELLGGAKISDHLDALEFGLSNGLIDRVLTGGLLGQLLLHIEGYNLGEQTKQVLRTQDVDAKERPEGLLTASFLARLKSIYEQHKEKFELPVDLAYVDESGQRREIAVKDLPAQGIPYLIGDNGTVTADKYAQILGSAKTRFVKGPQGIYKIPAFRLSSEITFQAVGTSEGFWMTGGGDTDVLVRELGLTPSYTSLAGGAFLEFKAGKVLPALKRLAESAAQSSSPARSSSPAAKDGLGGIDLRNLPIMTQPVLAKALFSVKPSPTLLNLDLDKEWQSFQRMLEAGITPSTERLKEYCQASILKQSSDGEITKVICCIADILRMEEESCQTTPQELKDLLVALES